jgi:putative RNA 2'-phosphotransferase
MDPAHKHISKFLSLVLRHRPESIGLALDESGWAQTAELMERMGAHGTELGRDLLRHIVDTNEKKRFELSTDGARIRASQGHSLPVDLGLEALPPPETLYHGTATRFLSSIRLEGLRKGARHHVHLSTDTGTAVAVGGRHGKPVVLRVEAGRMVADGHRFYRSANGVWLVEAVPPAYIMFENGEKNEG